MTPESVFQGPEQGLMGDVVPQHYFVLVHLVNQNTECGAFENNITCLCFSKVKQHNLGYLYERNVN